MSDDTVTPRHDKEDDCPPESPDIHFEPVVKLSLVEVKTLEEDEDILFAQRAKLFRFDTSEEPAQWKERGVGDIKILRHKEKDTYRIVMRRDKTLKICANHYIYGHMELKSHGDSDRTWMWKTLADFSDEECREELLAIRFANAENALLFKHKFDETRETIAAKTPRTKTDEDEKEEASSEDSDDEATPENSREATPEKKKNGQTDSEKGETPKASSDGGEVVTEKLESLKLNDEDAATK